MEVSLSETVVFELLDWTGTEGLCEHLGQSGRIRICECRGAALVSVELGPEEGDLAVLLRAAKHWLDDDALGPIRFHLDGRSYMLESGTAIRPAA